MKRVGIIFLILCLFAGVLPLRVSAANLEVEAKSALLMDAATGTVLYEQNAHEPLAPASVTKVMTMLLALGGTTLSPPRKLPQPKAEAKSS